MISYFYQKHECGNRDYYCSQFLVFFEITSKFLIVFVDWYWGKCGLTDLPGHDGKLTSDMNEFSFKVLLKYLGCK